MTSSSSSVGTSDPQKIIGGTTYWVQNSGASYGLQQTSANSLTFQVEAGDTWQYDDALKNRSEIASTQQIANGTPIHIQYDFDVRNGAVNTAASNWTVLGQLHQNDGANAVSAPPPFAVELVSGKMAIQIGYTDASGANVVRTVWTDSSLFVQGANNAMDISITFDPNGNGHLSLARNGVTLVNYTGPLGYAGQTSVYWKEGIYRSATSSTETADFSNLSVATGGTTATAAAAATPTAADPTIYSTTTDYDPTTGKIATARIDYKDGHYAVTSYINGVKTQLQITYPNSTSETDLYNVDGSLATKTTTNADRSTIEDWYTGGQVTQHIETNNVGTQTLVEQFDAAGMISKSQTAADGTVNTYKYDDAGNVLQHVVREPNYYRTVTNYGITGQNYTTQTGLFNALNQLYSLMSYRSDGTLLSSQSFTAAGKSTNTYDASGTVLLSTVNLGTDGSREVFDYAVQGQQWTSDHYLYDKTGQVTLLERFLANGKLLFNATFGTAGVSHYYIYATSGLVSQMTSTYASGAKIIYDYAANGVTVLQQRIYSTSGTLTNLNKFNATGTTLFADVFRSDGSSTSSTYDANGALLQKQFINADGSGYIFTYAPTSAINPIAVANLDTSGRTVSRTIYNPDGSKEVDHLIVTGQAYASDKIIYNSAGTMVSDTTFNANGSLASSQVSNANGSVTSNTYDGTGTLLQTKIVYADASRDYYQYGLTGSVVSTFTHLNPQGALSAFEQVYADGRTTTTDYGITGKAYASQMIEANAAGATQDIVQYNTDGTRSTTFYASGVALSFGNSADKITSFGGETMTFASSLFRDTIQSFHGGAAAGHDTIVLSKALVADFSHLAIKTAGTTTTVSIDSQHTFTLINPTGAVTAADFKFV